MERVGWDNPDENRKIYALMVFGDGEPRRLWRKSAELDDGLALRRSEPLRTPAIQNDPTSRRDGGRRDFGPRHQVRL